jgi:hypothetical protein
MLAQLFPPVAKHSSPRDSIEEPKENDLRESVENALAGVTVSPHLMVKVATE